MFQKSKFHNGKLFAEFPRLWLMTNKERPGLTGLKFEDKGTLGNENILVKHSTMERTTV